jgi:hypothetical protein
MWFHIVLLFVCVIGAFIVRYCLQRKYSVLKFIHVTKCGGTSIEDAFRTHGLNVGRYHTSSDGYFWHDPVPEKIRGKYVWFAVVRDPYTRTISEYHCKWGNPMRQDSTVGAFNSTVRSRILSRGSIGKEHYTGHWETQTKYLFPGVTLLRFEDLQDDLDQMMLRRGLDPISLPVKNIASTPTFTVDDFDVDTISLINVVYARDFEYLEYPMITIPKRPSISRTYSTGKKE